MVRSASAPEARDQPGRTAKEAIRTWRAAVPAGRLRGIVMALLGATVIAACGAPEPEEIAGWDASDETSVERIDHGAWQDLLDRYVAPDEAGVNLVDYEALQADAGDAAKLAGYLDYLQGLDPRDYNRAEQMAYWINFYNALTVKVVLDAYPVETIRDIHEGVVPYTGPWDDVHASVAGEDLTLNHMEHGILRPIWQDERIHYAVNCAAYGCPHLLDTAFTAANTEELLDAGARDYVNNPRGVDVVDEDFVVISSIYDWYTEDFGNTEETVMEHLVEHAEDDLGEFLQGFEGALEYDYDWSLNRQQR